uniref:Reverse transcriptase domain-containing protein n=1 Tax=Panagrellus redivivus TaxID=6233 RepID=A0A7E4VQC1_PANRE
MEKCGSDIGDYLLTVNTVNGQKEIATNKGQLQLALTAGGYETFTVHAIPKIMEKVEIVTMDENNKLIAKQEVPQLLIGIGKLLELFNSGPEKMENGNYKWSTTLGTAYGGGDTAEEIWCALTVKEEEDDMDNLDPPAHWMLTECGGDTPTDDEIAKSLFQGSLRRDKNGRYTAKLLFREPPTQLPSNYKTALAVLAKTVNELTTINALEKYNKQIWTEIEAGTTEIVTPTTPCGKQKHYLIHRGLFKDDHRTSPLRLIYNGSMKNRITKRSLNSYLYRGPIKLPKIPGCVWRFRRAKIVMIADIQKAFHQVGLDTPDRDFTRFLWLKDITKPVTSDNIMILRFTSVPFGIVTSPSLLGMTLEHHLNNHELPLARSLLTDLYVDNVFMDVEDVKDGIQKYHDSKQIFRDAQMNLREYMTNNSELNEFLMEQEGHTIPEEAKFLGVNWKMKNDDISFHLTPIEPSEKVTLRTVLENISKPFDTSGLLCPALLEAKVFYQKAFANCASRGKVNWDENLTEELQKEWQSITENWHGSVRTPRYIPALSSKNVKVDIFTDASDKAIGAMAYVSTPKSQPVLLQARQRLAPSKAKRTTPQLEVAAILEGVNLLEYMREELPELETAETTI